MVDGYDAKGIELLLTDTDAASAVLRWPTVQLDLGRIRLRIPEYLLHLLSNI
jgi:hypothetical protein